LKQLPTGILRWPCWLHWWGLCLHLMHLCERERPDRSSLPECGLFKR